MSTPPLAADDGDAHRRGPLVPSVLHQLLVHVPGGGGNACQCKLWKSTNHDQLKGPSTLATLFNHMWPRIVAGIFIPVGNHYFQALASTLQFVAQVCDRLWLVPATDRAFAYITYMSPPHVALVCSGPPQCAATCGWTKWPVCSGPKLRPCFLPWVSKNRRCRILNVFVNNK